jgi:hypothetical protein
VTSIFDGSGDGEAAGAGSSANTGMTARAREATAGATQRLDSRVTRVIIESLQ